jgi:hypothetical protein
LATAAVVLVAVGFAALLVNRDTDADPADNDIPAACAVDGADVGGELADDPAFTRCLDGLPDFGDDAIRIVGPTDPWQIANRADGWTLDVAAGELNEDRGALLIPGPTTRFVEAELRVEATVVAGHADYRAGDLSYAWYELVVTTATQPSSQPRPDATYATDYFAGHPALSCRIMLDGVVACQLHDQADDLVWEATFFKQPGTSAPEGGFEDGDRRFTPCNVAANRADCLDRVTLEFADGAVTLRLNGDIYFRQGGLDPLPAALTDGQLTTWWSVVLAAPESERLRFHGGWG